MTQSPVSSRQFVLLLLLLISTLSNIGFARSLEYADKKIPVDPNDPGVRGGAEFFLEELKKLSDSGIYRTLKLVRVETAHTQRGVFHDNLFMTVSLASPHFDGGASISKHDVIVMRKLEDDVRSFAIDEFPIMDENAIEDFWIQKVEAHRRDRERLFRDMEIAERERQRAAL